MGGLWGELWFTVGHILNMFKQAKTDGVGTEKGREEKGERLPFLLPFFVLFLLFLFSFLACS